MIVNYYPGGSVNKLGAPVKYTGSFYVKQDPNNPDNWECHLLTSGTLNVTKDVPTDIFLVGGGGAGSNARASGSGGNFYYYGGNGGGGGRTSTINNVLLERARTYTVQIGDGGVYTATAIQDDGKGGTTSFADGVSISYTAAGGECGYNESVYSPKSVKGGRSGGYGCYHDSSEDTDRYRDAQPGSPRKNETFPNEYSLDRNVNAFWEVGGAPYAGGGAGGGNQSDDPNPGVYSVVGQWGNNIGGEGGGGSSGQSGLPNTGGGGGGGTVGYPGGNGGSGIVIIRNHRA